VLQLVVLLLQLVVAVVLVVVVVVLHHKRRRLGDQSALEVITPTKMCVAVSKQHQQRHRRPERAPRNLLECLMK
jgi:hypothetical protein